MKKVEKKMIGKRVVAYKKIGREPTSIGGWLLLCGLVFTNNHVLVRCRIDGVSRLDQLLHNWNE